jgi:hypothetical protein
MRILWVCLAGLTGAGIGLLLGTVGVFCGCLLLDKVMYPNGVPTGGGGLMAVGWIFVFITAPAGVIIGGTLGVAIGLLFALLLSGQLSKKKPPAQ